VGRIRQQLLSWLESMGSTAAWPQLLTISHTGCASCAPIHRPTGPPIHPLACPPTHLSGPCRCRQTGGSGTWQSRVTPSNRCGSQQQRGNPGSREWLQSGTGQHVHTRVEAEAGGQQAVWCSIRSARSFACSSLCSTLPPAAATTTTTPQGPPLTCRPLQPTPKVPRRSSTSCPGSSPTPPSCPRHRS